MKGFLKCSCEHCGGHIEFPGSAIDTVVACPHCSGQTRLVLEEFEDADNAPDDDRPRRVLIIAIVIVLVSAAAIAGGYYYLKAKAKKINPQREQSQNSSAPMAKTETKPSPAKSAGASEQVVPEFPTGPEHPVDPDPARHRLPLEMARRVVTAEIKSGRDVYRGHCSECHVFYDPSVYNAEQWPSLLNKMEGKAKLGRDERDRLERFVQTLRTPGT